MSSTSGSAPARTFDSSLGALLIGGLIATALWGVTCVQTFTFFTRRLARKDSKFLKLVVTFLWLLDTFNSGLDADILYSLLITNYANPAILLQSTWGIVIHVATSAVSDFTIRAMFVHRIYRVSNGNRLITAVIMACSMANLITGLMWTIEASKIPLSTNLFDVENLLFIGFGTGVASDLGVTVALIWFLLRSRSGIRKTNTIINKLMMYTVNTGLIVVIDAVVGVTTFIVMPHNFIYATFYLIQNKLYHNSYLAMLNARDDLRAEMGDGTMSIHLSNISTLQCRSDGGNATIQNPRSEKGGSRSQMMAISVNSYTGKEDDRSLTDPPHAVGGPAEINYV